MNNIKIFENDLPSELDLSDEVQEWITDMTPFDKPLEETDKKHEMLSLNDLESQLWPS